MCSHSLLCSITQAWISLLSHHGDKSTSPLPPGIEREEDGEKERVEMNDQEWTNTPNLSPRTTITPLHICIPSIFVFDDDHKEFTHISNDKDGRVRRRREETFLSIDQ